MSIHKSNIETLLSAFTKSHATGSLKAAGNVIPELVKSLVAFVEEKTGGAPIHTTGVANTSNAPIADAVIDPLHVIGNVFTQASAATTGEISANAAKAADVVASSAALASKVAEVASDAVALAQDVATVKDLGSAIAAAPSLISDAAETVKDAAAVVNQGQGVVDDAAGVIKAVKDEVVKATKGSPKKA